jgi:hypothetical protein
MLSPFLILSLFKVKETAYVFTAFPAVAFLLAYGFLAILRGTRPGTLLTASSLSTVAALFFYCEGSISPAEFAALVVLYLFYAGLALTDRKHNLLMGAAIAGTFGAMLMGDVIVIRNSLSHRTYYREVGAYFRPALQQYKPQQVIFKAPEYAALEFYLFRSGEYWQTYSFHQSFEDFLQQLKTGRLAFYVIDPTGALYGGGISPEKLAALREYTVCETSQVKREIGRNIPLELFVARAKPTNLATK